MQETGGRTRWPHQKEWCEVKSDRDDSRQRAEDIQATLRLLVMELPCGFDREQELLIEAVYNDLRAAQEKLADYIRQRNTK